MKHFLLVFDRAARKLIRFDEYLDRHAALDERFSVEEELAQGELEVVVLSAESREALRATHARYFKSIAELAEDLDDF